MQLTINIDNSNFGVTVEKLFDELTTEDRRDLAKQILTTFLNEPLGQERAAREQAVIAELMERKNYHGNPEFDSERSARTSYHFTDKMKGFKGSKEKMVEFATEEMTKLYKELVTDLIKENKEVEQTVGVVRQAVENAFPEMVQIALTNFVVSGLSGAIFNIGQTSNMIDRIGRLTSDVKETLNNRRLNVQPNEIRDY